MADGRAQDTGQCNCRCNVQCAMCNANANANVAIRRRRTYKGRRAHGRREGRERGASKQSMLPCWFISAVAAKQRRIIMIMWFMAL